MNKLKLMLVMFVGLLVAGNASATPVTDIVDGAMCNVVDVTATGFGSATDCLGLYDNEGAGGMNDSEGLLNNELFYGASSSSPGDEIWGTDGAFDSNDWMLLGKDDRSAESFFIDGTSGDPYGTWTVDGSLYGAFLIAVKQGGELGLWYFDDLMGASDGMIYFDEIFGDGFDDEGWSHISIYGTPSSTIPEPGMIGLLAIGLLGMVVARRRKNV